MARRNTTRDYYKESDPDFNPQFSRRWTEPPSRKKRNAKRPAKIRAVRHLSAKAA